MATCSRAPLPPHSAPVPAPDAGLAGPGMKGGRWALAPVEEVMKPRAPLKPAADLTKDLPRRGKRFSAKVPMTKEEEQQLVEVKLQHMSGKKKLLARIQRRDELRKRYDKVLFERRCWAATMANQVVSLRANFDHVRHQLRVGWKDGDPLPEELTDARRRSHSAFTMNEQIGEAMKMGLDPFLDEYRKLHDEYRKLHENEKMRHKEVEAETIYDRNGAPLAPVLSN